jgi:hypothetical protein
LCFRFFFNPFGFKILSNNIFLLLSVIEEIYYIPSVIIKCSHRVLVLLQSSRF